MSLTRIALGQQNEFKTDESFVLEGKGFIRDSYLSSNFLKINTPSLKIVINKREENRLEQYSFLRYVNNVLEENNLYFFGVEFKKRSLFSPNILKGTFYKLEKKSDSPTLRKALNSSL